MFLGSWCLADFCLCIFVVLPLLRLKLLHFVFWVKNPLKGVFESNFYGPQNPLKGVWGPIWQFWRSFWVPGLSDSLKALESSRRAFLPPFWSGRLRVNPHEAWCPFSLPLQVDCMTSSPLKRDFCHIREGEILDIFLWGASEGKNFSPLHWGCSGLQGEGGGHFSDPWK